MSGLEFCGIADHVPGRRRRVWRRASPVPCARAQRWVGTEAPWLRPELTPRVRSGRALLRIRGNERPRSAPESVLAGLARRLLQIAVMTRPSRSIRELPVAQALRELAGSSRGDAAVEYVVLLGTIAIPLVPVLIALGVWQVGLFENMRNLVVAPIP